MASSGLWTVLSGLFKAEARKGDSPELYFRLTRECMEQADRMTRVPNLAKLNYAQCKYLSDKLRMVVRSASSSLELMNLRSSRSVLAEHKMAQSPEIFKLLFVFSKEVESFIRGCCKDPWIQSAIMLTNVSEHVSSLGVNLEICSLLIKRKYGENRTLSVSDREFVGLKEAEVGIIKAKAESDESRLFKDTSALIKSCDSKSRDWQLANFVLERLERERWRRERRIVGGGWQESNVSSYFEILDKGLNQGQIVGAGSFGTVYKAKWFGADVAKRIFNGGSEEDFSQEVSILEGLRHPNIVSLLWYMRDVRKCYLIMELMDKDLFSLIQERLEGSGVDDPPFSITEALHIMLQVGEGMLFLHEKRIVHRDLKSHNILVRYVKSKAVDVKYVQVKVADFGLSKTKDRSVTTSTLTPNQGTTRWMAPELISTANEDGKIELSKCEERLQHPFKVDVYSFGMVCYEILSGKVPFAGIIPSEVKKMVLAGDRPHVPDQCPERLTTMIEKCWSADPSKRPRFSDICAELRHLACAQFLALERPRIEWEVDPKQAISEVPSPSRPEAARHPQRRYLNRNRLKEIREDGVDMKDGAGLELSEGRAEEEHEVEESSRVRTMLMIKWLILAVAGWLVAGWIMVVLISDTLVATILSSTLTPIFFLGSVLISISSSTVLSLCFIFVVVGIITCFFWKFNGHGQLAVDNAEDAIPTQHRDALVALNALPSRMAVLGGQLPPGQTVLQLLRENGDVDLTNAAAGVLEANLVLLDSQADSPERERSASTILEMAKADQGVRFRMLQPGLRGLHILVQYVQREQCTKKMKELLTETLVLFCRDGRFSQEAVIEAHGDAFLLASLEENISREEAAQGLLELVRNPVGFKTLLEGGFVKTAMGSISQTFAPTAIAKGLASMASRVQGLYQIYSASSDSALGTLLEKCSDRTGQDAAAYIIARLLPLLRQGPEDLKRLNKLITETCPGLLKSLELFYPYHVAVGSLQALAAFATHMMGRKIIHENLWDLILIRHLSTRDIHIQFWVLHILSKMTSDIPENSEDSDANTEIIQATRDNFFQPGEGYEIIDELLSILRPEEFRYLDSMQEALIILRNLSRGGPYFCDRLVDQGAVHALLTFLRRAENLKLSVIEPTLAALEQLLDGSKGIQAFMNEGGIETVVAILKANAFAKRKGPEIVSSIVLTMFVGNRDGNQNYQTGVLKDEKYCKPACQAIYKCGILAALNQIMSDNTSTQRTKWKAALLMANSVLEFLGSQDSRLRKYIEGILHLQESRRKSLRNRLILVPAGGPIGS